MGKESGGDQRAVAWRTTARRASVRLGTFAVLLAMLYTEAWGAIRPEIDSPLLAFFGFAHIFMASFWHYLGFAAAGCLALACVLRLKWTAAVAVLALVAGLVPWLTSWLNNPQDPDPERSSLTVYSANVLYKLDDLSGLIEQIEQLDPDIVLLQEVHHRHEDQLRGSLGAWGHVVMASRPDAFGQAVFSRIPFAQPPVIHPVGVTAPPEGWPPAIQCTIEFEGIEIDLVNVHTYPPGSARKIIAQDLMARGLAEIAAGSNGRAMIMGGDFNSPERGQPVRRIRAEGLRTIHADRGRGLGATWPRITRLKYLPGTRIDQVLYRDLALIDCGVGDDFGSDHRPIWAVFQAP